MSALMDFCIGLNMQISLPPHYRLSVFRLQDGGQLQGRDHTHYGQTHFQKVGAAPASYCILYTNDTWLNMHIIHTMPNMHHAMICMHIMLNMVTTFICTPFLYGNHAQHTSHHKHTHPTILNLSVCSIRLLVGGRVRAILAGGAPLSPYTHDYLRWLLLLLLGEGSRLHVLFIGATTGCFFFNWTPPKFF